MGALHTYGFLNAKVRAMRSNLLLSNQYKALSAAHDFRDLIQLLSQYGYEARIEEMGHPDPERLEMALRSEEVRRLQLIHAKSSRPLSNVFHHILEKFEAERLKWVLRFWFQKRGETNAFLLDPILYLVPAYEILDAPTLDDVIGLLEKHPFRDALVDARPEFEAKKSLFPFELAIDREQIRRFFESVKRMNRRDRRICHELAGIEIDLKNLGWIERFKQYYQMSTADILTRLLPGGNRLSEDQLRQIVSDGNPGSVLTKWAKDIPIPAQGAPNEPFTILNLELFLKHVLFQRARKAFMEFPFSVGAIMGYHLLLRIEMMNLRTLIQSKVYGLGADEIESRLIY